jgi:hypothetical protein
MSRSLSACDLFESLTDPDPAPRDDLIGELAFGTVDLSTPIAQEICFITMLQRAVRPSLFGHWPAGLAAYVVGVRSGLPHARVDCRDAVGVVAELILVDERKALTESELWMVLVCFASLAMSGDWTPRRRQAEYAALIEVGLATIEHFIPSRTDGEWMDVHVAHLVEHVAGLRVPEHRRIARVREAWEYRAAR